MNWDRSETIALAKEFCVYCKGEGQRSIRKGRPNPCNCVLRAIFRACYARFRHCVKKEKFMSKVSLVPCRGKDRKMTFARLDEDYICDFYLVSKRALTEFEFEVFRNHFLLGADWKRSDTGREAKFYRLTPRGRAHLESETESWEQLVEAVALILKGAAGERT